MRPGTIFALASGAGRAGIAVFRLSGPQAGPALVTLAGCALPRPRHATRVRLVDPMAGEVLDEGLALWFPAPASFTGEDVIELHIHGGRAVIAGVAECLGRLEGLRPAEPGEFSRRAFEHGKMDLTAAEGLADLVAAETAAQRRQALSQMHGHLAELYNNWRGRLVRALAHVEAEIDFPEEDLPEELGAARRAEMRALLTAMRSHLADGHRGERLREGVHVAILGAPNAGKSSLLNRLARREAAIVSERAGTTRDIVEVHIDLAGYPVVLADTAGLREAGDAIESEGIRRALARAGEADLRLVVVDAATWPAIDPLAARQMGEDALLVINKVDRYSAALTPADALCVSAKTGAGMDALVARLEELVAARYGQQEGPGLTRTRHRVAVEECVARLDSFLGATAEELAAEDLRLAARALGRITGAVDVEELLDVVFREFCIGK